MRSKRGLETAEKIKRAFAQLVAEKPAEQITVREIADRAGVSKASVYEHFVCKGRRRHSTAKQEIMRQLNQG
ncbi:MAG: helix-turn-helix transcriptional regulator [Candidatus Doudnabacteria bacterium]|nr:helix-turn-helix transcriptional regulator [Candidatus Doudnabacteria bacterium]